MGKEKSGFKAQGVFLLNPEKFTEIDFQLDEGVNRVVFEMAKKKSAEGDQQRDSVLLRVNVQKVTSNTTQSFKICNSDITSALATTYASVCGTHNSDRFQKEYTVILTGTSMKMKLKDSVGGRKL
jgi:hypothetical protein